MILCAFHTITCTILFLYVTQLKTLEVKLDSTPSGNCLVNYQNHSRLQALLDMSSRNRCERQIMENTVIMCR